MLKLLVPVDGSKDTLPLINALIAWAGRFAEAPELHLINIQPPLHGEVGLFISREQIRDYHHDEGMKALQAARNRLDQAKLGYHCHIGVGNTAEAIVQFAREHQCDQIVMGSHGRGALGALLLDSVATDVIHLAEIPVLLIRTTTEND